MTETSAGEHDPTIEYFPDMSHSVTLDSIGTIPAPSLVNVEDALLVVVRGAPGVARREGLLRHHLAIAVRGLYLAWYEGKCLAYPGRASAYSDRRGRLYQLGIGRQICAIIGALEVAGYVHRQAGWLDQRTGVGRVNRAWASEALAPWFGATYRAGLPWKVPEMAADDQPPFLRAYNDALGAAVIDLGAMTPAAPWLDRIAHRKFIYRRFSDAEQTAGGRFYGGWWQQVPRAVRRWICIDGDETVELDFKAQHPTLLYARKGLALMGDPYAVEGFSRQNCKLAFNACLNAENIVRARQALRQPSEVGAVPVDPRLADVIVERHPAIAEFFFSAAWRWLQRKDSEIASRIIARLLEHGITALAIHDSFIVARKYVANLEAAMGLTMAEMMIAWGAPPVFEINSK